MAPFLAELQVEYATWRSLAFVRVMPARFMLAFQGFCELSKSVETCQRVDALETFCRCDFLKSVCGAIKVG